MNLRFFVKNILKCLRNKVKTSFFVPIIIEYSTF